jgi:pyridoxal 5'-phosphate synthase pdxT subunit
MQRVGVLALQGDFQEHIELLNCLGVEARAIRLPREMDGVGGLIIPGGESTTIGMIAAAYGLVDTIRERAAGGMPVWGTCAGMIVLAKTITRSMRGGQPLLGLMDITVQRNAFGRQVDSFEADVPMPALGAEPFHCVFIRAPRIEAVGPGVEVLGKLAETGEIIAAQQGRLLVTSFHPELTSDTRVHRYFLSLDENRR